MATVAGARPVGADEGFFAKTAIAMAVVIVAGFSLNLGAGRSSFAAPALFHVHAVVFFGWVALYVVQSTLAGRGNLALHRRLGWLALGWIPAMLALGIGITFYDLRERGGPFFFDQNEFLFGNVFNIVTFAGLAGAAIAMRRRTDWHRRLIYCAMAGLTGPGFGRLLPMPLIAPWSWWAAALVMPMIFPLIGIIADLRRTGRVHAAWWVGTGASVAMFLLADAIAYSSLGYALTHALVDGAPGGLRPIHHFQP